MRLERSLGHWILVRSIAKRSRWQILVRRELREGLRELFEWCAPLGCATCGERAGRDAVCSRCRDRLEAMPVAGCARCGEQLTPDGRCLADHRPLRGVDARVAPFRYRGAAGGAVRRFKFLADPAAEAFLVRSLTLRLLASRAVERSMLVMSVPMHARKRRRRGRDPAAELAAALADRLGLAFDSGGLRRTVDTLPQADPRVLSRARNVEGVFELRRGVEVQGRTVLLIDDVSTSGATASACARVLRRQGARRVVVGIACVG